MLSKEKEVGWRLSDSSAGDSLGSPADPGVLCAQMEGGGFSSRGQALNAKLGDRMKREAGGNSCYGWVTM